MENRHIVFFKALDLEYETRLKLRKLINENNSINLVIISDQAEFASLSWEIGAFCFLKYPITERGLKVLKHRLKKELIQERKDQEKLKMTFAGGFDLHSLDNICAIEGQGNYCKIYFKNEQPKIYTARIGKLGAILEKQINFCRITKSIIINVNNIAQLKDNNVKFISTPKLGIKLSVRASYALKKELLWLK